MGGGPDTGGGAGCRGEEGGGGVTGPRVTAEAMVAGEGQAAVRECLGPLCRPGETFFESAGPWHRMCRRCTAYNEGRSDRAAGVRVDVPFDQDHDPCMSAAVEAMLTRQPHPDRIQGVGRPLGGNRERRVG